MDQDTSRLKVLLVEDDENDIIFFRRALGAQSAAVDLEVVTDGEKAIQTLSREPLPDWIVLDLKLPRRSGLEVLAWIRATPATRRLPVIIMTSSGEPSDLSQIRELEIDEYIVKPVSYQGLVEIVHRLCAKWGVLVPDK